MRRIKIKNYESALKAIASLEKESQTMMKRLKALAKAKFTGKKKLGRPFGSKSKKKKSESRATA